jgi:hypothetical protein
MNCAEAMALVTLVLVLCSLPCGHDGDDDAGDGAGRKRRVRWAAVPRRSV